MKYNILLFVVYFFSFVFFGCSKIEDPSGGPTRTQNENSGEKEQKKETREQTVNQTQTRGEETASSKTLDNTIPPNAPTPISSPPPAPPLPLSSNSLPSSNMSGASSIEKSGALSGAVERKENWCDRYQVSLRITLPSNLSPTDLIFLRRWDEDSINVSTPMPGSELSQKPPGEIIIRRNMTKYIDKSVVSGLRYSYSLILREPSLEERVLGEVQHLYIPKDILIKKPTVYDPSTFQSQNEFDTNQEPTLCLTENGKLFFNDQSVRLRFTSIFSKRGGIIGSFSDQQKAPMGQHGRDAKNIEIHTEYFEGTLELISQGENGGDGLPGLNGEAGKQGADGEAAVLLSEQEIAVDPNLKDLSKNIVGYIFRGEPPPPYCKKEPTDGQPGLPGLSGGRGFQGGAGGNAGSFIFEVEHQLGSYPDIKTTENNARGGNGGEGGEGGDGGPGGNPGKSDPAHICQREAKPGPSGPKGVKGEMGLPGPSGSKVGIDLKVNNKPINKS